MLVGQVRELWRHPVKSMRGDRVATATVTSELGVCGDRGWAIRDEEMGQVVGAKTIRELMKFHARYRTEPTGPQSPHVDITFPDGRVVGSDAPQVDALLSEALERQVSLWPRQPAENWEHYLRRARTTEEDVRSMLDIGPDDPLPDFSDLPEEVLELRRFATPVGTYFDAMPISLLTTTSMASLSRTIPDSVLDPRRFRKNLIVDSGGAGEGHPEMSWLGRTVRVGEVVLETVMPISRCVMVTLPQADLPKDRRILQTIARTMDSELGIYLRVLEPGIVREGDAVELLA